MVWDRNIHFAGFLQFQRCFAAESSDVSKRRSGSCLFWQAAEVSTGPNTWAGGEQVHMQSLLGGIFPPFFWSWRINPSVDCLALPKAERFSFGSQ